MTRRSGRLAAALAAGALPLPRRAMPRRRANQPRPPRSRPRRGQRLAAIACRPRVPSIRPPSRPLLVRRPGAAAGMEPDLAYGAYQRGYV